jgi:hypothetical protein
MIDIITRKIEAEYSVKIEVRCIISIRFIYRRLINRGYGPMYRNNTHTRTHKDRAFANPRRLYMHGNINTMYSGRIEAGKHVGQIVNGIAAHLYMLSKVRAQKYF